MGLVGQTQVSILLGVLVGHLVGSLRIYAPNHVTSVSACPVPKHPCCRHAERAGFLSQVQRERNLIRTLDVLMDRIQKSTSNTDFFGKLSKTHGRVLLPVPVTFLSLPHCRLWTHSTGCFCQQGLKQCSRCSVKNNAGLPALSILLPL